jgi:hypothetical protein
MSRPHRRLAPHWLRNHARRRDAGEGRRRGYDVPPDQAWTLARTVFRWEGSDAIEEQHADGSMLTTFAMSMVSAGTVATVLTESRFHQRFEEAAAIVKSGRSLPLTPP